METPTANREETCYFWKVNSPQVSLTNNKIKKKFTLSWTKETLPHFVEWKSMAIGDYALGLEPCTTELDETFKYAVIKENETKHFSVKMTINNIEV